MTEKDVCRQALSMIALGSFKKDCTIKDISEYARSVLRKFPLLHEDKSVEKK